MCARGRSAVASTTRVRIVAPPQHDSAPLTSRRVMHHMSRQLIMCVSGNTRLMHAPQLPPTAAHTPRPLILKAPNRVRREPRWQPTPPYPALTNQLSPQSHTCPTAPRPSVRVRQMPKLRLQRGSLLSCRIPGPTCYSSLQLILAAPQAPAWCGALPQTAIMHTHRMRPSPPQWRVRGGACVCHSCSAQPPGSAPPPPRQHGIRRSGIPARTC